MELLNKLRNCTLKEIKKTDNDVTLVFFDEEQATKYRLSFIGYVFETPLSPVGKKVEFGIESHTLGFKAFSQINFHNQNPTHYTQLFFKMESPDENFKSELICVYKKIRYRIIKDAIL